jgi:uncharacterized membrane protein YjgN (DUF898 family)
MKLKLTIAIIVAAILLISSCTIKNKALYTKKSRWVPGNAKHFQQRHNAKIKKQQHANNTSTPAL